MERTFNQSPQQSENDASKPGSYWEQVLSPLIKTSTQTIKNLEGSALFTRIVNTRLELSASGAYLGGGSASQLQNSQWLQHLQNLPFEVRLRLQDNMKQVFPGLDLTGKSTEKFFAGLIANSPETLSSIAQLLISLVARFTQWAAVSGEFFSDKFSTIESVFSEQEQRLREEQANKTKVLAAKLERLDKLVKGVGVGAGKGGFGGGEAFGAGAGVGGAKGPAAAKVSKEVKELERLKVRVVALEKQNAFLVAREKDLEYRLSVAATGVMDGPKQSEKKKKAGVSKDTKEGETGNLGKVKSARSSGTDKEQEGVMLFDAPMLPSKKKAATVVKKVIVSKQEKMDRLETSLLDYTTYLSNVVLSLPTLPIQMLESSNFTGYLEMVVDLLPKVDKRKDLLADRSGWVRGILEIASRLVANRNKVKWSDEQELVGAPDALPLKISPKTTYWIKVVENKALIELMAEMKQENLGKLVVQEPVTKKLLDLMTGFTNYLRVKIAENDEKIILAKTGAEFAGPGSSPLQKTSDTKTNLKKLKEAFYTKISQTKTLLTIYIWMDCISHLPPEQTRYFQEEAQLILQDPNWQSLPLLYNELLDWYSGLSSLMKTAPSFARGSLEMAIDD